MEQEREQAAGKPDGTREWLLQLELRVTELEREAAKKERTRRRSLRGEMSTRSPARRSPRHALIRTVTSAPASGSAGSTKRDVGSLTSPSQRIRPSAAPTCPIGPAGTWPLRARTPAGARSTGTAVQATARTDRASHRTDGRHATDVPPFSS